MIQNCHQIADPLQRTARNQHAYVRYTIFSTNHIGESSSSGPEIRGLITLLEWAESDSGPVLNMQQSAAAAQTKNSRHLLDMIGLQQLGTAHSSDLKLPKICYSFSPLHKRLKGFRILQKARDSF